MPDELILRSARMNNGKESSGKRLPLHRSMQVRQVELQRAGEAGKDEETMDPIRVA